jgi:elongation factor P
LLSTADFKKGLAILVEGQPYVIMEYSVQTPSARGAATLVRVKARQVITGQVFDLTFKSGDKLKEPDLERRKMDLAVAIRATLDKA